MQTCSTCGKSDCTTCDGRIEVRVNIVLDNMLNENEILTGRRFDNASFMVNNIKNKYKNIGVGICKNKNKPINLYLDDYNHIYGVSTILPYRYFELEKVN